MGAAERLDPATGASGHDDAGHDDAGGRDALSLVPEPVEVRRNAALAAALGVVAAGVAIAYLARASSTGAALDWVLTAVVGALAAAWLGSFVDARSPLLVADAHGVRIRLGRAWRGLTWDAVADLEHHPRRGLLRDGRLVVVPHDLEGVLTELDPRTRRQAAWSARLHGAPLAVPLGLATRVVTVGPEGRRDGSEALQRLADRAGLLSAAPLPAVGPEPAPQNADDGAVEVVEFDEVDEAPAVRDPRPGLARVIGRVADLFPVRDRQAGPHQDPEHDPQDAPGAREEDGTDVAIPIPVPVPGPVASPAPAPLRETQPGRRQEVTQQVRGSARAEVDAVSSAATAGAAVVSGEVEVVDDEVWGARVTPLGRAPEAEGTVDVGIEPAPDPVVGPVLATARERLGLSIDSLAERTRIRPHVIEAIEADDFVPCGGDFYARGHLRTLARVLGVDSGPLLADFDERYADAPIDPRRVFEAELATGVGGTIRGTRGGPNWSVLVAVVMALVLCWSVARLVMDSPPDVRGTAPVLNGSGGPGGSGRADLAPPVPVVVSAQAGGAHVVVRDGAGEIVLKGNLAIGQSRELDASPPLRVQTSDGAVTVRVDGEDRGPVGEAGVAAQGTYVAR